MEAFRSRTQRFLFCALCLFLATQIAPAQVDQGTVTGIVQDASGAVIVNAQVDLKNVDTNLILTTRTNATGFYVFPPVKVGIYSVAVSAAGFEKSIQENVRVDVQSRLKIDVTLRPGEVSETVTVTSAPPALQSQSGAVGQVLTTDAINNIPLNSRNWVYTVQLAAGVVPSPGTHGGGTGDFSANGQRAGQNNFLMDGVDNNANVMDLMNGESYNVRPPPDALAEFKVDTADYNAELGHSAGAAVNVSLKSGTNQIHGDLWEYVRNTALDAQNWTALTIPPYHENQFGATLGFPILKNKLFFFADSEANRVSYAATGTYTVPTPLMRQGNFTELLNTALTGSAKPTQLYQPNSGGTATLSCNSQNNVFCPGQIDTVAQNILKMYPLPNANGWNSSNNSNTSTAQGITYNNLVENLATSDNTFQWDTRLDWNIRPADQAFARLSYSNEREYIPGPLGTILNGSTNYKSGAIGFLIENMAVSETHIFNPRLFNELRFGINHGLFSYLQPGYNTNLSAQLGLGGIPYGPGWPSNGGLPEVSVSGITGWGSYDYDPSIASQNVYQILDNLTKVVGNHSLKVGINLQSIRVTSEQPTKSRGNYSFNGTFTSNLSASYTGNGVADFLADQMASASITNEVNISDVAWYKAAYAQDDWKISRKLTLNLGLRYDYFQPYRENAGAQANFVVTSAGIGTGTGNYVIPTQSQNVPLPAAFSAILAQSNIALQYSSNAALVNGQFKDFGPRIGFAFAPDRRTVLSGGFGIFYGGLEEVGGGPNMGLNFPFGQSDSFTRPSCAPNNCPSVAQTLETGFSTALAAGLQNYVALPSIQGQDPNSKITNTMSYNFMLQRSIASNMVASAAYVGNIARHLVTNYGFETAEALINPANSTLSVEPFPDLGGGTIMWYTGQSNYNSLQAKLDKRFSNELSFLATYTWAHALDDSYDPLAGGVSDRNLYLIPIKDEYTNSPYDVRQRINFNGFYNLPFGHGRKYMNRTGLLDIMAGGWSTDLAFSAETGKPLSVSTNVTTAAGGSSRAIKIRNPFVGGGTPDPSNPDSSCPAKVHIKTNWYNPCAFANPPAGSTIPRTGAGSQVTGEGNALLYLGGRANVVPGPGYERINMSLFKDFRAWRENTIEFRADAFNLLNTPSYAVSTSNDGPTGGLINGTQSFQNNTPDARFFQLSAKYKF